MPSALRPTEAGGERALPTANPASPDPGLRSRAYSGWLRLAIGACYHTPEVVRLSLGLTGPDFCHKPSRREWPRLEIPRQREFAAAPTPADRICCISPHPDRVSTRPHTTGPGQLAGRRTAMSPTSARTAITGEVRRSDRKTQAQDRTIRPEQQPPPPAPARRSASVKLAAANQPSPNKPDTHVRVTHAPHRTGPHTRRATHPNLSQLDTHYRPIPPISQPGFGNRDP